MKYYVISVLYGMVPTFINCVYLKFINPGTESLGQNTVYQYHILIGTHQEYFWPSFIILALYQPILLTFFLKVNLEKRLILDSFCRIISVFRSTLIILLNLIPPS